MIEDKEREQMISREEYERRVDELNKIKYKTYKVMVCALVTGGRYRHSLTIPIKLEVGTTLKEITNRISKILDENLEVE